MKEGWPRLLCLSVCLRVSLGACGDHDSLAFVQDRLRTSAEVSSSQPEYARPHVHGWEKAKDNLIAAGSFVDNFFKKTKQEVGEAWSGWTNAGNEAGNSKMSSSLTALASKRCEGMGPRPEDTKAYLVDNSKLNAGTNGIGFRFSKRLTDRDLHTIAHWGSVVMGVDQGDGWLKVGDCYVPMLLQGTPVLRLQSGL